MFCPEAWKEAHFLLCAFSLNWWFQRKLPGSQAPGNVFPFSRRLQKALDLSAISAQWAKRLFPDSPQPLLDRSEESNDGLKKQYLIIGYFIQVCFWPEGSTVITLCFFQIPACFPSSRPCPPPPAHCMAPFSDLSLVPNCYLTTSSLLWNSPA